MADGFAGLGQITSASAMQGLWLGVRKVGSQVLGKDLSRVPGRGTVGKARGGRR